MKEVLSFLVLQIFVSTSLLGQEGQLVYLKRIEGQSKSFEKFSHSSKSIWTISNTLGIIEAGLWTEDDLEISNNSDNAVLIYDQGLTYVGNLGIDDPGVSVWPIGYSESGLLINVTGADDSDGNLLFTEPEVLGPDGLPTQGHRQALLFDPTANEALSSLHCSCPSPNVNTTGDPTGDFEYRVNLNTGDRSRKVVSVGGEGEKLVGVFNMYDSLSIDWGATLHLDGHKWGTVWVQKDVESGEVVSHVLSSSGGTALNFVITPSSDRLSVFRSGFITGD